LETVENKTLDNIVENLLYVLPIIHKKIFKINPPEIVKDVHLSRLHVGIMEILYHEMLPISDIARRFLIPKPQMTLLICQLVSAGVVERQMNEDDRRMIVIALTEKGKTVLRRCEKNLRNNIEEMLSDLNKEEQEGLSLSLQKLREIGSKWDSREKESNGLIHLKNKKVTI
jgi:DNA-binding MarR family transcriptional regulator